MATYQELYALSQDQNMIQKVTMAIAIAAEDIRSEPEETPNHIQRVAWAQRALLNPDGMARQVLLIALAQNAAISVEAIQQASDEALLSAVNSAIALLM